MLYAQILTKSTLTYPNKVYLLISILYICTPKKVK